MEGSWPGKGWIAQHTALTVTCQKPLYFCVIKHKMYCRVFNIVKNPGTLIVEKIFLKKVCCFSQHYHGESNVLEF